MNNKSGKNSKKPQNGGFVGGITSKLSKSLKSADMNRLIRMNIPYAIMGVVAWIMAGSLAFIPLPNWVVGIAAGVGLKLMVYVKGKNAKKWRKDIEYGSARWGNKNDIAPFIDENPANNIILTQTDVVICRGQIHRCQIKQRNHGVCGYLVRGVSGGENSVFAL